ncbi:MAG: O-antigen ligase family protein [Novosphingobium sp.]|nr:O-antigen ligase family protein [Novosphingobium sp.]
MMAERGTRRSLGFRNSQGRSNPAVLLVSILLGLSIVLGGGGTPNPLSETLLMLAATGVALAWLTFRLRGPVDRRIVLLILLALALPLVQLIPLPPAIWHNLPGRDLEAAALRLTGDDLTWRAFSIAPSLTVASLLSLGPPLLVMALVAALPRAGRERSVQVILAMALAAAVLGAAQLAGGPQALRLYPVSHTGWLTGFHANRNAAADLLLIGLVALFVLTGTDGGGASARLRGSAGLRIALGLVLVAAIVLTGSRAGIALLALFLAVQLVRKAPALAAWVNRRGLVAGLGFALFAAAGLALVLRSNAALTAVATRFTLTGDARGDIWRDAAFAARTYWPAGSGIGTFVPAFLRAERLEAVDASFPNRAHNDYLEWMVEAGLPGVVLAIAGAVVIAMMAREAWHDEQRRPHWQFAWWILLVIALHSCVDYPLRSMAIACLAGAAIGLLARVPGGGRGRAE